jgi:hypothetical protein
VSIGVYFKLDRAEALARILGAVEVGTDSTVATMSDDAFHAACILDELAEGIRAEKAKGEAS